MPSWMHDPEAIYVVTAYGVATGTLAGLALVSWYGAYRRAKEWAGLQRKQAENSQKATS